MAVKVFTLRSDMAPQNYESEVSAKWDCRKKGSTPTGMYLYLCALR